MDKTIGNIRAREILDSRGNPTIEVKVTTKEGIAGKAAVPSGASTGRFEATELRDRNERYRGKGVLKAVSSVNHPLAEGLKGEKVTGQSYLDLRMNQMDGTEQKSSYGANGILGISLAAARTGAKVSGLPLYQYIGGVNGKNLPVPMMNVLNGGAHAANNIDIQEFMIMPVGASSFREGLRWCVEVYHTLADILKREKLSTGIGDEGGFAPDLKEDEDALKLLVQAIEEAGYVPGSDFKLAIDGAASEWKSEKEGVYYLPKAKKELTREELIGYWERICKIYPVFSIEDPMDEEDWKGWQEITKRLGDKVQLVGDDLFVTNTNRLAKGIRMGVANAILIKVNQIGTLTESLEAVEMAHKAGYRAIISHRSGETADTFISDLAVGVNAGQIKTGAPCRSDRVEKYNRLLEIEDELGIVAKYENL